MKPTPFTAINVDNDGFLYLQQFHWLIDISKIEYYQVLNWFGTLTIRFYDKQKNIVLPYGQKQKPSTGTRTTQTRAKKSKGRKSSSKKTVDSGRKIASSVNRS